MKLILSLLLFFSGYNDSLPEQAFCNQCNVIMINIMYGSERYKRCEYYTIFSSKDSNKLFLIAADNFVNLDTTITLGESQVRYIDNFINNVKNNSLPNENKINFSGTWTSYKVEVNDSVYTAGYNFAPAFFKNVFSMRWPVNVDD